MAEQKSAETYHVWLDNMGRDLSSVFRQGEPGVYWCSVDLALVMRGAGVHHSLAESFANDLLQTIRDSAGPSATILVSAFNFQFPQTQSFDVDHAPVQTGAFGGMLLRRLAAHRTPQPFYSFLVFGPGEQELLARIYPNSTGYNSIFDWLIEHRGSLVTIGHHYVKSLTSAHHAEDVAGISYRYQKTFTGTIIQGEKRLTESVSFFVRQLGLCDHSALTLAGDTRFRQLGLVQSLLVGAPSRPILVHKVSLAAAHEEMVADLRSGAGASGAGVLVNYLGPQQMNVDVITPAIANRLYLAELAAMGGT